MKLWEWFIEGMASISIFPIVPDLPSTSDAEAIASDWKNVGDDIRNVIQ